MKSPAWSPSNAETTTAPLSNQHRVSPALADTAAALTAAKRGRRQKSAHLPSTIAKPPGIGDKLAAMDLAQIIRTIPD